MKVFRKPEQIEDVLLPEIDFVPRDARGEAIVEVLCRIPDLDYRLLVKRISRFSWFIPDAGSLAQFECFDAHTDIQMTVGEWTSPPAKLATIIYMSPELEKFPPEFLRRFVADKLAHVLLKHETIVRVDEESETKERTERCQKLRHWGFEDETLA